jgi:hypothetical protein
LELLAVTKAVVEIKLVVAGLPVIRDRYRHQSR